MQVWRIYDRNLTPEQAISGWGSFNFGGRWNSEGFYVVYASEHLSLAAFEKLVHLDGDQEALQTTYLQLSIEIPDALISDFPLDQLPEGWDSLVDNAETQSIGNNWLKDEDAPLALRVPSKIIKQEFNLLINPNHDDWDKIDIAEPTDFNYDPSLSE
ncbi:MAG: RES family NAD+ phosphorylase [Pseudomonadales bacterium]|nr:RES family NAD+ phosphorylase [Pseudomonadales bacterium]